MANLTWTSAVSEFWSTSSAWTPAQVPGPGDVVVFDGSGSGLSFVSSATIQDLLISDPSALLTVQSSLDVQGRASILAGTLAVQGADANLNNLSNTGTVLLAQGSRLTLSGTYDSDSVERIFGSTTVAFDESIVSFTGTMLNTGKVFDATLMGAVRALNRNVSGTIVGGTVVGSVFEAARLDGVTLEGPITLGGVIGSIGKSVSPVEIDNGLTAVQAGGVGPGTVTISGLVDINGDTTLDNMQVLAGVAPSPLNQFNGLRASGTLTLGTQARITLAGTTGAGVNFGLGVFGPTANFVNLGTIDTLFDSNFIAQGADMTIGASEAHNFGAISLVGTVAGSYRYSLGGGLFVNEAGGLIEILEGGSPFANVSADISGGDFVNNGSVLVSRAAFEVQTALTGNGVVTVRDEGTISLLGSVSGGQTIALDTSGTVALALPSFFQGTITGLTQQTELRLAVEASAISYTSDVLTLQLAGGQTFGLNILGSLTLADFNVAAAGGVTTITTGLPAPCFAAGTQILTTAGKRAVETLRPGMPVVTAVDGMPRTIKWIGHRDVDCARHPDPAAVWPVRIAAHAFGRGMPSRPLLLSPDHAVFFENTLIPVKHLINGDNVTQVPVAAVSYFHVELDQHDVILAEGLPVETYLDTGDRDAFDNGGAAIRLFPRFRAGPSAVAILEGRACAPLVITGPVVDRARGVTNRPRRKAG